MMVQVKIILKDGSSTTATMRDKWWGYLQLHITSRHDNEVWDIGGREIRVADIQTAFEVGKA